MLGGLRLKKRWQEAKKAAGNTTIIPTASSVQMLKLPLRNSLGE
jgi:hypothetical protein